MTHLYAQGRSVYADGGKLVASFSNAFLAIKFATDMNALSDDDRAQALMGA